jgi:alkylation response protein AidB-like acyl-CoA dehydrogenase
MLLSLERDQELFRETTAKLLNQLAAPAAVRALRDHPNGFAAAFWRRGADLGWTSLLVSEAHGGGSISSRGLVDLALVAYEFGRHAAPGPLGVVNVVAATLSESGGAGSGTVISELLTGRSVATWCQAEPRPNERFDALAFAIRLEGDEVVLHGEKRPVESAGCADHFLVSGRTSDGVTQVLVPATAAGLSTKPMKTVDLTRRFSVVSFDQVRVPRSALVGAIGGGREQYRRQLQWATVIANAEAVGTMRAAFDLTTEWAFDRYSFGRPLASYQEIKHRFADMLTWLEAGHAISDAATHAVATGSPDADELVSAAKAFIGHYGAELIQDCVQIHGGIGVTFDHDIHLYLRRHTVNRALLGTPGEHRQRLAALAPTAPEAG